MNAKITPMTEEYGRIEDYFAGRKAGRAYARRLIRQGNLPLGNGELIDAPEAGPAFREGFEAGFTQGRGWTESADERRTRVFYERLRDKKGPQMRAARLTAKWADRTFTWFGHRYRILGATDGRPGIAVQRDDGQQGWFPLAFIREVLEGTEGL